MTKPNPRTLAAAGFMLVMALACVAMALLNDTRSPHRLAATRLKTLQKADVATLRARVDLGLVDDTEQDIATLGKEELERRLKLWRDAKKAATERYTEARKTVRDAGDAKFDALPYKQQAAVRDASRNQFLFEHGKGQLRPEEATIFGSAATLFDEASETTVLSKLTPLVAGVVGYGSPEANLLGQIRDRVRRTGREAEDKLDSAARRKMERRSKLEFIAKEGFGALSTPDQALFGPALALLDEDNDDALVEKVAIASLTAQEKTDVAEARKADKDNSEDEFIDSKGVALLQAKLTKAFAAVACSVSRVDRRGYTFRSVLRSTVAVAYIACAGDTASPHRLAKGRSSQSISDREQEAQLKIALAWTGRQVVLAYDRGEWAVAGDNRSKDGTRLEAFQALVAGASGSSPEKLLELLLKKSASDPTATASAAEAVRSAAAGLLAGPVSAQIVVIVCMIGLLFMVLRRRTNGPVFAEEWVVLAVVFALAGGQFLLEGRVSADDWLFTPFYLAVPVWYGTTRGATAGFVVGFATALVLLVGATCFAAGDLAVDVVPISEYLVFALVLAGTAAGAGAIGPRHPVVPYLPLVWCFAAALLQRDLLLDVSHYAMGGFGAVVVVALVWYSEQETT